MIFIEVYVPSQESERVCVHLDYILKPCHRCDIFFSLQYRL